MPMPVACFLRPVFVSALTIMTAFPAIAVAETLNYVVVRSGGPVCSLIVEKLGIEKLSIGSFHVLIPAERIADFVTNNTVVNTHVCECALLGGDVRECAVTRFSKAAIPVQIGPAEQIQLAGRIFVRLDKPSDFLQLYTTLARLYPHKSNEVAWKLLAEAVTVPPAPPPPNPPFPPPYDPNILGGAKEKKQPCEFETSVCINPESNDPSAELEVKCEGLPPMVFSTDLKAGIKVGPVEVSFSPKKKNKP